MSSLIWLASYPKSGNTWMRAFLRNYLADADQPVDMNAQDGRFANENTPSWYQGFADLPLNSLNPTQVCALRPHAHARIATSREGTVLTKTHNYLGDFDGFPLHNIEVTAGAIYILRNPLDVVPSLADHFGMSVDDAVSFLGADEAATQPDEANMGSLLSSWSFHVASWTAEHSEIIKIVRYEDMLEQPVATFSRVLRLLHMEPQPQRLERAIAHASFDSLQAQEQAQGFVERSEASARFFRVGKKDQWREVLNDSQIAAVVAAHREQMQRFGYVPEGY